MSEIEDTVVVFTAKSPGKIVTEGGSQSWKLSPAHVERCEWLVCTQNAHNDEPYADGGEPHGSAFLLARITGVGPSTPPDAVPGRWKIEFSEYALVSVPAVWPGNHNPVHYTNLAALGIRVEDLEFHRIGAEARG
ncbi:hypothetical protein [Nocardia sp. NPDC057668]|uniref:hypothetical protein n=1 Tax=Nocardia sp. NPDC057668 TaxID=3346202 RepID=UPI00366C75CD